MWVTSGESLQQDAVVLYIYLDVLHNDRELPVGAVSRQQVLARAGGGEELVVEGLDVGLPHHQALT